MPYPLQYATATQMFHDVLERVRRETALSTTNQAYTVLQGVLLTFRRRVEVQQSLRFADLLPAAIRALYVHRWDVAEPLVPFGSDRSLVEDVRSLRPAHNSAPDTCVADVARAVRAFIDERELDALLSTMPGPARRFWTPGATRDR